MAALSSTLSLDLGGDASASRRTAWIPTQGFRNFSLEISLPGTNAPVGVISIETSNNGTAATGVPLLAASLVGMTQPSGSAWSVLVDAVITDASYIAVVYTRTSGGFGAFFGDAGGTGAAPKLVFKGSFLSVADTAVALDLRTVRVAFDPPGDDTPLDASLWTLTIAGPTPLYALPTPLSVTKAFEDGSAYDVYLNFELSPGIAYTLTYDGNVATFTAPALPVVAGRAFRMIDWIPEMNLRDDDTGDLRKFISALDENIAILLNDVDRFGDIQDPDLAAEHFVDQMLSDMGNPFTEAPIDLTKKRILARSLIPIFKSIGTAKGITDAIWFFLGLESTLTIVNRQGMRLGISLLTVDWVLGCGPDKWRILLKVATPAGRAFTPLETTVLKQILTVMKYAHEHIDVQATLPAPTGAAAVGTSSPHRISVSWSAVAGATSYNVYMSSVTGVTTRNGSRWSASGTSLSFPMLTGKHRYFIVTALNAQGEGLSSAQVEATSA